MHWGWGYGDWWMPLIMLIFWVALIGLAVWAILRVTPRDRGAPRPDSAEEVLRQRFAAGEIDAEEYERRLEVLRRR